MSESTNGMQKEWEISELSGLNSTYLEALYEDYLEDPSSVTEDWQTYFGKVATAAESKDVNHSSIREAFIELAKQPPVAANSLATNSVDGEKYTAVMDLIYAYRYVGHRVADINPLKHLPVNKPQDLELSYHGLSESDLNAEFNIHDAAYGGPRKLKDIISEMQAIYCGSVGTEYMHITNIKEKMWVRAQVEKALTKNELSKAKKTWVLQRLAAADGLEKYLGMHYAGQKRFSLEGGDSLIPLLDEIIERAAESGTEEIVMDMAHRGRLNVLVNTMGKSPKGLFKEFEGHHPEQLLSGDVKYHMGFSSHIKTAKGDNAHLVLSFNPSHLEIVAPVATGSVRARQARRGFTRNRVLPIHMHGDAAFAGQGVVMETLNMSQTRGYGVGGSIHIVINNQVGFTTDNPADARSSHYCTDVAKMIEAPIFHVNGDDAEAVVKVAQIALDYQKEFNKDVIIDLVCYRRHGHQEVDEPTGTQPLMYKIIKKHPTPVKIYAEKLVSQGEFEKNDTKKAIDDYRAALDAGKAVANISPSALDAKFAIDWAPFLNVPWDIAYSNKLPKAKLKELGEVLSTIPAEIVLQKQVAKAINDRALMTKEELPINWGYAELLAYASLLDDGNFIRISGEDCGRGTFSHRHAILHDYLTGNIYSPLDKLTSDDAKFKVFDSILSEEAVLAFEYGFSSSSPNSLVVWEAQFGDFANGAQVVIDQFISSGEEKWGRLCGLVMLLPHGYEGMGAEHSSARLERYLQLCAHDNMQVCVPTTPAQIYHLLRRQMVRPYRKPLVVMSPKSLLRHPLVTSTVDELANGHYQNVIAEVDANITPNKVERVIICSGRVYYDLLQKRRAEKITDLAIIRLEQLYPFPENELRDVLAVYSKAVEIVWCQEEPVNQGAWHTSRHRLQNVLTQQQTLSFAGREAFAAPAVGYPSLHKIQQEKLVNDALRIKND